MCFLNDYHRKPTNFSTLLLELFSLHNSRFISGPDLRAFDVNRTTNQNTDYQNHQLLVNRNLQVSSQSLQPNGEQISPNGLISPHEQQVDFTRTLTQIHDQKLHFCLEKRILAYFKEWMKKIRICECFNYMMRPLTDCVNYINNMGNLYPRDQQERTGNGLERDSLLLDREIGYNQEYHWYLRRIERDRPLVENYNINDDIDEIYVNNHETEIAKIKLIGVLKLSVITNAIIAICHALLLIKTFDIELLCCHLSLERSQSMQNFQDNLRSFGCRDQNESNSDGDGDDKIIDEAFMARLVAGNKSGEENDFITSNKLGLYYLFIIVNILDTLNNLFWYHSRKTLVPISFGGVNNRSRGISDSHLSQIKFRLQQVTLLRSVFLLLSSPKQLFQLLSIGLFLTIVPSRGSTGIAISLHTCMNQAVRNLYNLFRVVCYLRKINNALCTNEVDDDIYHSNELAAPAYSDWQQSINNDDNDNDNDNDNNILDSRITMNHNSRHQPNRREGINISSRCLAKCDDDDEKNRGWSRWPIDLYAHSCELNNSLRHWFERVIMISQMICVKVTILAILCHIEPQKWSRNLYERFMTYFCLIESFLAMYFYYNKYHDRYN